MILDLNTLLTAFITAFVVGGGTAAFKWLQKNLTATRSADFRKINDSINSLYERVELMDQTAEKTHCEMQLSILRVGILDAIDRDDEISVIRQYTDYKNMNGNSYIHDKVHDYLCTKGHEEYCKGE